ncbi:MAG: AGE family epimerase/isomerase [Planctomycetota bacterium]
MDDRRSGASRVDASDVERWRSRIAADLWGSVVPFWMEHSLDREHGGYLNNLDRDGTCFDTRKHVWLQGRQVWMLARMFNGNGDGSLLDAARLGAEFLDRHAFRDDGRAYFSLTREGLPAGLQRKPFSECFCALAFAEYARATGDERFRARALETFRTVLRVARDPAALGRPVLAGEPATSSLAIPMILLNLTAELRGEPGSDTFDDWDGFDALEEDCVRGIALHFDHERGVVRETVAPDGARIDAPEGRLLNPGHAIEAAWFLLQYAERRRDGRLVDEAVRMLTVSLEAGWDEQHGGILYFLDADGFSPTQLEWSMKLWWPHCEAMIATLYAWRLTVDDRWWAWFDRVAGWTYDHFPDAEHGEWFGYLDREGRVSQRFKGGPYKGFFHVPRALMTCVGLLTDGPLADR